MSKTAKNGIMIILIVIIIFAIIWLVYDALKKEPADANVISSNLTDENTGLDNMINDLFENVIINEVEKENVVENKVIDKEEDNKQQTNTSTKTETPSGSVTSREEKAIALVKKEWGGEDGVYFVNESIDSQGRYIVSVRDKSTTNSIAYFLVDIEKELVTKK